MCRSCMGLQTGGLHSCSALSLPEFNWDAVWRLAVIILGVGIVWRAWSTYAGHGPHP